MASKTFFKCITQCQKFIAAAKEKTFIDIEDFTAVRPRDFRVIKEPFPHVEIQNFFKPEVYQALSEEFTKVQQRGFIEEKYPKDRTRFHLFDVDYDGYVYTPPPTLQSDNAFRIFYSLEWNQLFSKIFHQFTTFETSFAFHYHPVGDRTGFIHNDFANRNFRQDIRLSNGVKPICVTGENGVPCRRIIAILFFLNNDDWKEGDGGELGIYRKDNPVPVKKIAPRNNTLFAFQISADSFHAFQTNNKERNSFVQWFHIPPDMV